MFLLSFMDVVFALVYGCRSYILMSVLHIDVVVTLVYGCPSRIEFPTSFKSGRGQPIQVVFLPNVLPPPTNPLTGAREFTMNAHEYGNATKVAIRQNGKVFIMISTDNTPLHGDRLMNLVRLGCHKKMPMPTTM